MDSVSFPVQALLRLFHILHFHKKDNNKYTYLANMTSNQTHSSDEKTKRTNQWQVESLKQSASELQKA